MVNILLKKTEIYNTRTDDKIAEILICYPRSAIRSDGLRIF